MATPKYPMGRFPKCPSKDHSPVITGFITPGSDFPPPHLFDASISLDVFDPTEFVSPGQYERIRALETDMGFLIEVNWCICGPGAASLGGCWEINFYLDDVDGVGRSSGPLPLAAKVDVDSVKPVPSDNDVTRLCYSYQYIVPAGTVGPGVYSLLAVITLRSGRCTDPQPGPVLGDWLGHAQIPVLVFFSQ